MTDNKTKKALEWLEEIKGFCSSEEKYIYATTLQAEIERLQTRLEKTEIEIDDFCRRLCRMRMLDGSLIASFEDLQNYIKKEKSEAVKEFAERLKDEFHSYHPLKFSATEKIDNLVKEMVGDNNG